jgi:hypothetical protein
MIYCTGWSIWDVKRNENVAEKNPLYYQLMVHTCVGRTPLLCSNTLTLNMTATADVARFIPRRQVAPHGAQHFWSDLSKGHGNLLSEVSFILWSLSIHKWLVVPPHEKSGGVKSVMFVSHALALPRGWITCKPSILPTWTSFPLIFKQTAQRYVH